MSTNHTFFHNPGVPLRGYLVEGNAWYTAVGLVVALTFVLAILAGLALGGAFSPPPTASAPPVASALPTYLYFTVTTSAHTLYDTYYPANVTVPHGVPVVITITSYDNGVNPVPSPYADVIGTVGGSANFTLGPDQTAQELTSLPQANISHSFSVTVPGMAGALLLGAGKPMVNVPVPNSPDGIHPATVTFTVTFPSGNSLFEWRCIAPCDPYSMQTSGFMIGAIGVT
ncbi:MAG: hypothetical protein L3J97_00645 [Thermoplasmata archaeon]|nr:hypothetical protein [Thermoplasmata archaeon]